MSDFPPFLPGLHASVMDSAKDHEEGFRLSNHNDTRRCKQAVVYTASSSRLTLYALSIVCYVYNLDKSQVLKGGFSLTHIILTCAAVNRAQLEHDCVNNSGMEYKELVHNLH